METRKQEFVGTIRKCPNCGGIIESFQTRCPSCAFELNNVQLNNVVEEFFKHIENFDAEQMAKDIKGKAESKDTSVRELVKGSLKEMFDMEAGKKARQEMVNGTIDVSDLAKKKGKYIQDFAVPVDKGSLFEFMSLAISHYDPQMKKRLRHNDSTFLNEAWKTKIREVYAKCVLAFESNSSEMQKIEKIMGMLQTSSDKEASSIGNIVEKAKPSLNIPEINLGKEKKIKKSKIGCCLVPFILFLGLPFFFGIKFWLDNAAKDKQYAKIEETIKIFKKENIVLPNVLQDYFDVDSDATITLSAGASTITTTVSLKCKKSILKELNKKLEAKIADLKINKSDFNIELVSFCDGVTFDNDTLKSLLNAKVGDVKKIFVEKKLSTSIVDEKEEAVAVLNKQHLKLIDSVTIYYELNSKEQITKKTSGIEITEPKEEYQIDL